MSRLQELLEDLCRHARIDEAHQVMSSQELDIDGVCVHLDAQDEWLSITAVMDPPPPEVVDHSALMRAALAHSFDNRTDPAALRFSLLPDESAYGGTLMVSISEVPDAVSLLSALTATAAIAREEFSDLCLAATRVSLGNSATHPSSRDMLFA